MPIVFVHGVPESDAIWDPLIDALGARAADAVRLSPPGFGAPVPDGFVADRRSYVAWLRGALGDIDGPIDLVGHDWGAGHVYGLMAEQPGLVRSWAADVGGIVHPDYVWHDMAQLWRTPGVGEETIAGMMGASLDDKAALMQSFGMSEDVARRVAAANDDVMGECILTLYRSADPEELHTVWDALPNAATRPGLVLLPTEDTFVGPADRIREVATRCGAQTAVLDGLAHWWMVEDPAASAEALSSFWDGL